MRIIVFSFVAVALLNGSCSAQNRVDDRIVCYFTDWSMYRPQPFTFTPENIDPNLCTHLIYAFTAFDLPNDNIVSFDPWSDIDKKGFENFATLKRKNPNLVLMVAIGGWREASKSFSPISASEERRARFAKNVVAFLKKWKFDGINLDWQFPTFRKDGNPQDYDNYVLLVKALRDEFEAEAKTSNDRQYVIAVDVPAVTEYVNGGFDLTNLQMYSDFFNILCYDYHYSYDPIVNHHSPLYPLREEVGDHPNVGFNVDATIKYLIGKGLKPKNMNLGIPAFGRSYTLLDEKMHSLGSASTGEGKKGDASQEEGYITFNEACLMVKNEGYERVWVNRTAMGPYAHKGKNWVSYDDEASAYNKGEYARRNRLGGIVFWTLDDDDFSGNCTGTPFAFTEAGKSGYFSLPKDPATLAPPPSLPSDVAEAQPGIPLQRIPTPPTITPQMRQYQSDDLAPGYFSGFYPKTVYIWVTNNVYNLFFHKDPQVPVSGGVTSING